MIATPLIFSALAVAVCYKAAMFNIGVEGQYLVAMAVATIAAAHFGFLGLLQFPVVLVFAMIGGMAWAAIPAVLKVKTGAHEVVTTIMLNGVAVSLVAWALRGPLKFTDAQRGVQHQPPVGPLPEQRDGAEPGAPLRRRHRRPAQPVVADRDRVLRARVVPAEADAPRVRGARRGLVTGLGARGRDLDRRGPDQGVPDLRGAGRAGGHAADPRASTTTCR